MLINIDFTFTDKHNKLVRDTAVVFSEIYNKTAWYGWLHRYRDHNKLFHNFSHQVRAAYALYPAALRDTAVRNAAKDAVRSVVMCDAGLPTLYPRKYRPMIALGNSTVKYDSEAHMVRLLLVGGYKDVSVTPLNPLRDAVRGKLVRASVYEINDTMCLRLAVEERAAHETDTKSSRSAIKKWAYESSWGRVIRI
jgi:hypothetical protein